MCLAQGPQRSDAGEARTHGTSVSSQALYHLATALPFSGYCNVIQLLLRCFFFGGGHYDFIYIYEYTLRALIVYWRVELVLMYNIRK